MSKITNALNKAAQERSRSMEKALKAEGGSMRNSWLIWVFSVGVIVTVFFAFNYEGEKNSVPLSEIFPDEETFPVDVEYEFVEAEVAPVESAQPEKISVVESVVAPTPTPAVEIVPAKVETKIMQKFPYTIQVASFKTRSRAEKVVEELKGKGMAEGYITSRSVNGTTWYRVYIGKFQSKDLAQETLASVKKSYKDSFVISPK